VLCSRDLGRCSAIADSFFTACQDACTIPHDRPVPSRESREETAGAHCPEPDDLDCRTISQNIRGMAFRTSTDVFRSLHLSQLLVEPPRPQSPDGEINPQKNVTKFDSPTTCEEAPCSSSKTDGGSPISPDAVLPRLSENLSPMQPPYQGYLYSLASHRCDFCPTLRQRTANPFFGMLHSGLMCSGNMTLPTRTT